MLSIKLTVFVPLLTVRGPLILLTVTTLSAGTVLLLSRVTVLLLSANTTSLLVSLTELPSIADFVLVLLTIPEFVDILLLPSPRDYGLLVAILGDIVLAS